MEIRKAADRLITDNGKDVQIVAAADLGKFLGDIDATDVVSHQTGHIITHPGIFQNGDDARCEESDGYGAEAEGQFGPHRQLGLLNSLTSFPEHLLLFSTNHKYIKNSHNRTGIPEQDNFGNK